MASWQATEAQLYEALDCLPDGIALFDAADRFVYWNPRYAALYPGAGALLRVGLSFEAFVRASLGAGDTQHDVLDAEEWIQNRLAQHARVESTSERQTADGRWIRARERRTSGGGSVGVRTDITDIKQREASFRLLFDANPLPMVIFDPATLGFLAVNGAALALYGYDEGWFVCHTMLDIRPERDRVAFLALMARKGQPAPAGARAHWTHLTADGREITVMPFSKTLTFQGRAAVLSCVLDLTEQHRMEARLDFINKHDGLTGLPNLSRLREQWAELAHPEAGREPALTLLRVRIQGLRRVNVSDGQDAEDVLLRAIADGLRTIAREAAMVARLGTEEFLVLVPSDAEGWSTVSLAARVTEALAVVFASRSEGTLVSRIGIASTERRLDPPDLDDLLRRAGLALELAEADASGGYRFFEPAMNEAARRRTTLERDLRHACEAGEFVLHYQPVIDLRDNSLRSFEALLRWQHPDGRLVPPSEFIPVAEDTGLIVRIGRWVLQQACRDAVAWPCGIGVAVNLSPAQFRSPGVEDAVLDALRVSGLDPGRLELEITETLLLGNDEATVRCLHALRGAGIGIALDDFGTGYASLGYLQSFPFSRIKIDRSFVSGMADRPECAAIVRAVAQLGADLGMATTAEGIEEEAQREQLRREGWSCGQGYLFSRPIPQAAALGFAAAHATMRCSA